MVKEPFDFKVATYRSSLDEYFKGGKVESTFPKETSSFAFTNKYYIYDLLTDVLNLYMSSGLETTNLQTAQS